MIFIIIGLIFMLSASCQIRPYIGGATADSLRVGGVWIDTFSIDGTMAGNSDNVLPTEKAVKTYVDAQAGTPTDSLHWHSNLDVLYNTTGTYTTTNATNFGEAYDSLHHHANMDVLYNTTGTYTTTNATNFGEAYDSLHHHANMDVLYNTTSSYTTAKDALADEAADSLHHHANMDVLYNTTASYTTAAATRLANIRDTVVVVINLTTDTLTSSEVYTGEVFPVGVFLNGGTVISIEAYTPDAGLGGTQFCRAYRVRSGASVEISDGAWYVGTTATINTDYDDLATGDYFNFGFYETGATTYSVGMDVVVTMLRP